MAGAGLNIHNMVNKSRGEMAYTLVDVDSAVPVSYTHLRAHETVLDLVCRLLLEKKKQNTNTV